MTYEAESGIINTVSEARESSIGIVNNQRLYPTTPEIQAFASVDSAVEYFKYTNKWGYAVSPIDKESFSVVKLPVLKEFCEGLHWAQVHFSVGNEMPLSIKYAKLGENTLGDYADSTREIRIRQGIRIEYAFTTGVHEMAHHADNLIDHQSCDIVKSVARTLKGRYTQKQINDMKSEIAHKYWQDPYEVLAYSVERYSVGKGNALAKAIAEEFLRRCKNQ